MKYIAVAILVVCAGAALGQTQERANILVRIAAQNDEEPMIVHDPNTNFRITSLPLTFIPSREAGAALSVHFFHFSPDRARNKDGREVILQIAAPFGGALPASAKLTVKTETKLYALEQGFPAEYKRAVSSMGEDHSAQITLPDFMEIAAAKSVKILLGDKIVLEWPSDKRAKLEALARAITQTAPKTRQ
jgi:hypothetical protein